MWQDIIKNLGWNFLGKCKCGGTVKERWGKKDYEVKVIENKILLLFHKGKKKNQAAIGELESIIQNI